MATKLIDSLEKLCKEVLDSDVAPKINIQLFTDIKETVDDLQRVMMITFLFRIGADRQINRIENEAAFQNFLSGFQLADKLVSVNLVEGVNGPGDAISSAYFTNPLPG
jgi:signal recognition particle GTPase